MPKAEQRPRREVRWHQRLAGVVLALFPMLVGAGVLAPQVVRVVAATPDEQAAAGESAPPVFGQERPSGKPPLLLVPREFAPGFAPDLLDLRRLFSHTRLDDPLVRQFARATNFPRSHGDLIVLDDVDQQVKDVVFRDPVMVGAVTDEQWDPPSPDLLPIAGFPRPLGDGLRFDDPVATGEGNIDPVPEPGTAVMLGAALGALALHRRARTR